MRAVWVVGLLLAGCDDSVLEPIDNPEEEEEEEEEALSPTWGECRLAHLDDSLEGELLDDCEALHRQAPAAREFGIRWVILDEVVEDVEGLAEERLSSLNALYAPAGISYRNSTFLTIEEPVATLYMEDIFFSIEEVSADIAQYLALESTEPADILDDFTSHMAAMGVSETLLEELSLDTEWSSREFLTIMGRALPAEIMVVVGPLSTEQGLGGVSHPPGVDATALGSDIVYLKSERIGESFVTLPHELGHYFGLAHTHAFGIVENGNAVLNMGALTNVYREEFGQESVIDNLINALGETLEAPLGDNYAPYDVGEDELLTTNKFREAARLFWDRPSLSYKQDQREFSGLADFVDWTLGGNVAYLKNFNDRPEQGPPTNNCIANPNNEVVCRYNLDQADEVVIHGSEAFLGESISSSVGTWANTMSYIRIQDLSADDLRSFFNEPQYDIVEVSANSPIRLHLRDYLQE